VWDSPWDRASGPPATAVQSTLAMAASSAAMSSQLQALRQELWLSLQQVSGEHWQKVLAASPSHPVTLPPFHQVMAPVGNSC